MFDPDKYRRTPYDWWPAHDRLFAHPLVGGLGLLALVASIVSFIVGDATTTAAFAVFAILVLPIILGLGKAIRAAVSSFW